MSNHPCARLHCWACNVQVAETPCACTDKPSERNPLTGWCDECYERAFPEVEKMESCDECQRALKKPVNLPREYEHSYSVCEDVQRLVHERATSDGISHGKAGYLLYCEAFVSHEPNIVSRQIV